jgi:dTDP-4-amino-4,6-dideoxygalactose transaminase
MSRFLKFSGPVITPAMAEAVKDTLLTRWITSGPRVAEFEAALSAYHGARPTRVFTSATAAMEVAFQVIGIEPGDEIITSAMTFFSVGNMIERAGAKTVFVDCDLATRNLDLDQVEAAITPFTKAILPCDMERLYAVADEYGVRVVEDAALAIGSAWNGKKIGSFGDIATFSFHPNKNMTTIEGGAAVFGDPVEAKRAETLRFHGIERLPDGTRDVLMAGGKFNMSDVSARLGLLQLAELDEWNAQRRRLARRYFDNLAPRATELGITLPARAYEGDEDGHSWNMFCILLPLASMKMSRKQFIDEMGRREIGIGISYEAMHLTSLFRAKGHREGEFPNAERIARETVTLPLTADMGVADVDRVCGALEEILSGAAAAGSRP